VPDAGMHEADGVRRVREGVETEQSHDTARRVPFGVRSTQDSDHPNRDGGNMGFQAAKCPSCAGDIQVPTDRDVVKCMYCGVDVVVREAIRAVAGPSAETLVDLGRKALDGANPTDAFQLFSRALEADPKNVAALMGKGEAAGWCSTIANMRFQEMSTYFNDAIKLAAPDAQEGLKQRAARSIGSVCGALWSQAQERFQRFASLDDTWVEFVGQAWALVEAYELALVFNPTDKILLENIITISRAMLQGFNYVMIGGSANVRRLTPGLEAFYKEAMEKATWRRRKLDPTFQAPTVERAKVPGCCVFIALLASVPIVIWLI